MGHGGDVQRRRWAAWVLGQWDPLRGDALYRQAGKAWGICMEGSLGSQVGPAWRPGACSLPRRQAVWTSWDRSCSEALTSDGSEWPV